MRDRRICKLRSGDEISKSEKPWRHQTVFVGGFPCQNLSVAGKREGLTGCQSGLWTEYTRLIQISRPDWVVTENVGHTWRRWVPELRTALWTIGYPSLPIRVRASDLGADHERSRIFIVAHANGVKLRELSRWWGGPGWEMAKEFSRTWDKRRRRLGSDDGLSSWVDRRRKAIGNAVVPQIAQIIAQGIKEVMK